MRNSPALLKIMFNQALNANGGHLFVTHTAAEWLFDRIASQDARDAFGIIVSYAVKVKLFLGALGGELCAELPFILMHPKVQGTLFKYVKRINN